jgi:imidazolonepropionase-like amidohydrolase
MRMIAFGLATFLAGCSQSGAPETIEFGQRQYLLVNADVMEIVAIGPDLPSTNVENLHLIDVDGLTLLPGLIDMHVHVFDEADLAASLAYGVTTIRNLGALPFHQDMIARIEHRELLGPQMITTGPIINEVGGRLSNDLQVFVNGAEEARAEVRRQYDLGYRELKLYSNLSRESFDAICEEAALLELALTGHPVEGTESDPIEIDQTLSAGFRTIEHTESIVWHGLDDDKEESRARALAEKIARSGSAVTPTLIVHDNLAAIAETKGAHISRPEMSMFNPVVRSFEQDSYDYWAAHQGTDRSEMQQFYERFTGYLHGAGVPIVVGTDAGVMATPHGVSVFEEMRLLKSNGLSALEAIRAATLVPARVLGLDQEIGSVREQARANFILVDGNPLEDFESLRSPAAVMIDGVWIDAEGIESLKQAAQDHSLSNSWFRLLVHFWNR